MRSRPPGLVALAAAALFFGGMGQAPALAQEGPPGPVVTYVDAEQNIYLNQGADSGLAPHMTVELQRGGKAVATVELVSVSAGRSAARIVDASRPPRPGDLAVAPDLRAPEPAPPPAPRREATPPLYGQARSDAWRSALSQQPRELVAFKGAEAAGAARLRVRAETEVVSRAYVGAPQLQRNEQRVSLWSKGTDLGITGLDLNVRGDVRMRYAGGPYDFMTGQLAVAEIREAALSWTAPEGLRVAVGRFKPAPRLAGVMDGAQLSWARSSWSVSAFGGLRPSLATLRPQLDVPALGAAATYTSTQGAQPRVSLAYLGELGQAPIHRISLDSSVRGEGSWLHEQATVRMPSQGTPGALDLLSVQGATPIGDKLTLRASARYLDQPIPLADSNAQTADWLAPLEGRALARADLGVSIPLSERSSWRPFVYYHQQMLDASADVLVAAGGASYARQKVFDTDLALEVLADYGDGTRQQARLGLNATTTPGDHLLTTVGLMQQWTYGHETGLHTFQHLAHGLLTYTGELPLELWLGLQGGFDHSAYLYKAAGGWAAGQLGVAYSW